MVMVIIEKMEKKILMKLLSRVIVSLLCTMFVLCSTVMAHDYTEEQVQAAKSWLSSHGYPPTEAGANQAYADFENGMWHDDPAVMQYLGITPAPTVAPTLVPGPSETNPSCTPAVSDNPNNTADNSNPSLEVDNSISDSKAENKQENNSSESSNSDSLDQSSKKDVEDTETSEKPLKDDEEIKKNNEESKKRETKSKALAVGIIVVAVAVVLVGGVIFLKRK